jgi:hypothetical protein
VLGAALAGMVVAVFALLGTGHPWDQPRWTAPDDHPVVDARGREVDGWLEHLVMRADGTSFEALAQDPTLARAATAFQDRGTAAYRAQRIGGAWTVWAISGGRPDRIPAALAAVQVLAAGALAAATAHLALRAGAGRRAVWAWSAVATPGGLAAVSWFGSDVLAVALALWGVIAAVDHGRRATGLVLLVCAVLTRDSTVVFAAAAALVTWRSTKGWSAALLGVPAVAGGAWMLIVRARIGAWPSEGDPGNVTVPFSALRTIGHLDGTLVAPALLAVVIAAAGLFAAARTTGWLRWVVVAHLLLGSAMGVPVWGTWEGFARVLLPVQVGTVVALACRRAALTDGRPEAPVQLRTNSRSVARVAPWPTPSSSEGLASTT